MTKQKNTYKIYDSFGRSTEMYVIASNKKEAVKLATVKANQNGLFVFILKRCYNGGVMG